MVKLVAFKVIVLLLSLLVNLGVLARLNDISRRKVRRFSILSYGIFSVLTLGLELYLLLAMGSESFTLSDQMIAGSVMISVYFSQALWVLGMMPRFLLGVYRRVWGGKARVAPFFSGLARIFSAVGALAGIALFAVIWTGVFYGRNHIDVKRVELVSPRVPGEFDGYRIVQISDGHVGGWGSDTTFVSHLVDSINALNPDVVVFTGDLVTRETSEMAPFMKVLSRIRARDGVYSVLGNHDYGDYRNWPSDAAKERNLALIKSWEGKMGWQLLNNENRVLRNGTDSIYMIGVENWGEPPFSQYGNLPAAGRRADGSSILNDSSFKVLLSHNPEHWHREVTGISNIDLTLAGHTHAMQFAMGAGKNKVSPASLKYHDWGGMYGILNDQGVPMHLYVNIGFGEVGLPSRMMQAYPEITEITLKRSK